MSINLIKKFKTLKKLLRTSFWFQSILPIVIGNTLLWTLLLKLSLSAKLLVTLLLFYFSSIGFFSLGYLINDFFDQSEDKEAGKSNIFATLNPFQQTMLFLFAIALSILPWLGLKINSNILILLISQISLYFLYNSPPFRLKNTPFLSNIIDASYAYLIPFILVYFLLASNQLIERNHLLFLITGPLLYFILGFRNILIHQIDDLEFDSKLKKNTTTLYLGFEKSAKLLFFLAAIELFLLLTFVLLLFKISSFYIILIPIILIVNLNAAHVYNSQSKNFKSLSQFGLLNNSIFQYYIPLLSSITLALSDSYYWFILLGFQSLFLSPKNFFLELLTPNKVLNDLWHKVIKKFWYLTLKPILGKIINYSIYYLFKLLGVDLIMENKSALSFLKDKLKKNNPKDR